MNESGSRTHGRGGVVIRRRAVLVAAALPWALASAHGAPRAGSSLPTAAVTGAVFDPRFAQSVAFAQRAKDQGVKPFGLTGELYGLWADQLVPALQSRTAPLLGLTTAGALFCFEQLAWSIGMRVRLRIDHRDGPDGVRHLASDLPPGVLDALQDAGAAFGRRAIDAALGCKAAWGDRTHAACPPGTGPGTEALVTWVIAPLKSA